MLVIGSTMIGNSVLSLHIGGPIGVTKSAVIDPENLNIIAYTVDGSVIKSDPEIGNILDVKDVRELGPEGFIINSSDVLVNREDIIHLDEVMSLNFNLVGLKVVTKKGKKIGKIVDYTFDSNSFMVYQLIVQRPVGFAALNDPQLTINRSQIVEIDDYKVTIKHDTEQVKVVEKKKKVEKEEFTPNFVNPFRKPSYAPDEASTDNTSRTSE
ncbi:PRC-barrel domain-containing protein [Candidatus Saccharibacteria bacterium]|nr:PRC-barrel domain-containing protein [Candidatus Saccharibacteria bacterium]